MTSSSQSQRFLTPSLERIISHDYSEPETVVKDMLLQVSDGEGETGCLYSRRRLIVLYCFSKEMGCTQVRITTVEREGYVSSNTL